MQNEWIKTQAARDIVGRFDERRPAWLWSGDGQTLVWQNRAAGFFLAKQKKGRLKPLKDVVPIKGQVRRLLRLGTVGLFSPARVRFLAGNKPVSATCSCLPVVIEPGQNGLLIVGVDPVEAALMENFEPADMDGAGRDADEDGAQPAAAADSGEPELNEPAVKSGDEYLGQLSTILDRLVNNSKLFEPLDASDDIIPEALKQPAPPENQTSIAAKDLEPETQQRHHPTASGTQSEEKPLWRLEGAGFSPLNEQREPYGQNVSGGGEQAHTPPGNKRISAVKTPPAPEPKSAGTADVDRVANYNFEELSRILKQRVNSKIPNSARRETAPAPPKDNKDNAAGGGQTIGLSEEMLVLNRLPIGILIFRDQQILFANRAFAALTGSSSVTRLREGGIGAVFPRVENGQTALGPVVSLVRMDGSEVGVDARLQTITWRGGPALMLSASEQNNAPDAETSVKDFARSLAKNRGQGYFEASSGAEITFISTTGARLLGQKTKKLISTSLPELVERDQLAGFNEFLEHKLQFAGTARAHMRLACRGHRLEMEIFTQGRAGTITGYFGIIRPVNSQIQIEENTAGQLSDGPLLGRLSRGIRRPLNTIVGFSELIYSEAFGTLGNPRYAEYAHDIKSAGGDIAQLVDEMDEYARLKDAGFVPGADDFNLYQLLDECMRLVRRQANKRRVFVRSAISESLPGIRADRASLRQAILNLLASAIDQTPAGGKVILSAQIEDNGSIGVHVRDSAKKPAAGSERFVVFREGNNRRGEALVSMKSSMGLALTRSLLAVNACALHVDPSVGTGTLMSLTIPGELFGRQN